MNQPAELLRRLQLVQVRARLCGDIDVVLKLDLMIATIEYLLGLETSAASVVDSITRISAEEVEVLKSAEEIYKYYVMKHEQESTKDET